MDIKRLIEGLNASLNGYRAATGAREIAERRHDAAAYMRALSITGALRSPEALKNVEDQFAGTRRMVGDEAALAAAARDSGLGSTECAAYERAFGRIEAAVDSTLELAQHWDEPPEDSADGRIRGRMARIMEIMAAYQDLMIVVVGTDGASTMDGKTYDAAMGNVRQLMSEASVGILPALDALADLRRKNHKSK